MHCGEFFINGMSTVTIGTITPSVTVKIAYFSKHFMEYSLQSILPLLSKLWCNPSSMWRWKPLHIQLDMGKKRVVAIWVWPESRIPTTRKWSMYGSPSSLSHSMKRPSPTWQEELPNPVKSCLIAGDTYASSCSESRTLLVLITVKDPLGVAFQEFLKKKIIHIY